jgi:hypothetical protein
MSKRKRFIITSIILSLGFTGIQFLDNNYRMISIGGLTLLTLVLFIWSLKEGLKRNLTLLTLILPSFFTLSVGIFWFLLPASIFARIPIIIFYGFGIYALCLTSNIYTVAAIRTIALLRAARGVGFVLTLLTSFLIFDAIFSLRINAFLTSTMVFLFCIPLYLQGLWVIILEEKLRRNVISMVFVFSLVTMEMTISLFFWPVTVVVGSLFLTVTVYILLGLGQVKLEGRFFPQIVREYLLVGLMVFIGMYIATRWGG